MQTREAAQLQGAEVARGSPSGVSDAVVIGGGTMGAGIAAALLAAGDRVQLVEASDELAQGAAKRVSGILTEGVRRGKLSADDLERAHGEFEVLTDLEAAREVPHLVIEAVPERLDLKREVLGRAERLSPLLLASNTSSLPITRLAEGLVHPGSFVGMHFFNPVAAMPLIEIVITEETRADAVEAATAVARRLGKEPIIVRDAPGFATSRLGVALGLEAIRMVEEGVADPATIDTAMELGYRHPMGPLRLTDIVGLDVRLDIARQLFEAYGERFAPPQLLVRMVEEGRLGRKTRAGFYEWGEEPE
jgi:3-hydroxybutyryl-CoA dehydrogenase